MTQLREAELERVKQIGHEVFAELISAVGKHGWFNSTHEGIAVIREEYLELEREVFAKDYMMRALNIRKEAIQIAAMALEMAVQYSEE